MMISFWCVFIAALLPYVFTIIAKSKKGYITSYNKAPRIFLESLTGFRQRASWAAKNSFECFPFFASSVIIAYITKAIDISLLNQLSITFIILRIIYGIFYMTNLSSLRSLVWFLGIIDIAIILIASIT